MEIAVRRYVMPPRKKKAVQKRTPGFTTIDKEVHDLLDTVRPVAERLYRKLHQRVNIARGDHRVYPDWDQLINDTGIKHRNTLSAAIKELEAAGLILVERTYNKELKKRNVNRYYIVPTKELPKYQIYQNPVSNLQKPSIKNRTVTRMKRTRMNITKMNKGNLKSTKEKSSSPHHQNEHSPDANKFTPGQYQKYDVGSGLRPMSLEESRLADEKWNERQARMKELT
jgi:hypothetical protein